MAFEMIDLSTKLKQASICDLLHALKVVTRLKDMESIVTFPQFEADFKDWKITVFTDASLGNINNGFGSTGAQILWMTDGKSNCCLIAWQANKIKRVVRSTIAAECLSLQEGLESAVFYRKFLEEITKIQFPVIAYVDNKSVIESLNSTKLVDDKRLRIDKAAVSESLKTGEITEIKW